MSDDPLGYAFGDDELAARRLDLVASVFEEASRAFVARAVPFRPDVVVDLGCGTGSTTAMLAEVTGARRVVGLDVSEAFLQRARARASARTDFVRHDATHVPLPGAPADVIYCRLLLAHLPGPAALVEAWMTQLRPAGLLLLDEVEWIETNHPVLAAYERVVVGLVGSRGGSLYAGRDIAVLSGGDGWVSRYTHVRQVPVDPATAARMFGLNLAVWRDDPFVTREHTAGEIDRLAADLGALAASDGEGQITWGLRQAVFERVATGARAGR